ncbi:hypothetical protein MMC21_001769 [Puttea exsequens]|nr:hypothetical protein [Puttea exsequens]
MCTKINSQPTSSPGSGGGGAAAGPIAGGVVGGILVVCLMTFLFWRFCIKHRRQTYSDSDWPDAETIEEKGPEEYGMQREARASVHSVRSIASTVLTRASNVIQIAYIPGVTNRSVESTPDLIPPVPPIPAASPAGSAVGTPLPGQQDQHFFMPSDLRDSTCSDYTVPRDSYNRSSLSPSMARGSVPSTAYRGSAIVNAIPAQTAIRGKANPVAVGSGGKNSPAGIRAVTPPVPIMDRSRHVPRKNTIESNTTSPIVARLGIPKAVQVKKAQSKDNLAAATALDVPANPSPSNSEKTQKSVVERQSVASSRHNADASTFDDASSSDEESPADQSLMGHDKLPQFAKNSSPARDSFFSKPSSAPDLRDSSAMISSTSSSPDSQGHEVSKEQKKRHKRSGSLNQIIQEAARRASREPRHGGLGSVGNLDMAANWRDKEGPFSDAHAAKTP